jgi:hypothetical protein
MRSHEQRARPQRQPHTVQRAARPVLRRDIPTVSRPAWPAPGFQTDPYVDYGRWLTPEGGVLFVYKDLDVREWHIIWRILAWIAFTGYEAWRVYYDSPVESTGINIACLSAIAVINLIILWDLPELYRSVEIRPDCLIIDETEVFWLSRMEGGLPAFQEDLGGNRVLAGIYGTRFVEYVVVRRLDLYDRTPEVFVAHMQEAMMQLWEPPDSLTRQTRPPRQQH